MKRGKLFPREKLPVAQSLYFDVPDGRMIFAIPRGKVTYVGTTDTNYKGSLDRVVATDKDVQCLVDAVNNTFPQLNIQVGDVVSNWAGLRPLIHEEEKDPSALSRKDEIFESDSGLISIAGGKLTGYRKMAQRVNEVVIKRLKEKHVQNSFLTKPKRRATQSQATSRQQLKKVRVSRIPPGSISALRSRSTRWKRSVAWRFPPFRKRFVRSWAMWCSRWRTSPMRRPCATSASNCWAIRC